MQISDEEMQRNLKDVAKSGLVLDDNQSQEG
jgi:hypothetical protein